MNRTNAGNIVAVHEVFDVTDECVGNATQELADASYAANHEGWIGASKGDDGLWHSDPNGVRVYVRTSSNAVVECVSCGDAGCDNCRPDDTEPELDARDREEATWDP